MKKINRIFLSVFILALVVLFSNQLFSQAPPPPNPPGAHGSGTNQNPLGAPIDGGMSVFLVFAALYGGREWRKRSEE